MSFESTSPNMSLILPGVGQTLGPQYAIDLNNSLTIVDGHNHTAGYGVPVPSSGLNINADLTMGNNNLIAIKSLRMMPQAILNGGSDLDCLFVNGVDLYYNDGLGNHVRITQSGGVAGSPGSIANLTSPASATYVAGSQTFVWQSAANTPANMDNASIVMRNLVANSFGLTLNPPAAMGSNFSITLPTLPISQKIMTLDSSGNMSAPYDVDNSTLEINANTIRVKDLGITTAKLAAASVTNAKMAANAIDTPNIIDGAVTLPKLGPANIVTSTSCGNFSTASGSFVNVTNLSVNITTTGRPVMIKLDADQAAISTIEVTPSGGNLQIILDGSPIYQTAFSNLGGAELVLAASSVNMLHVPSAAAHSYHVQISTNSGLMFLKNSVLTAYEF